MSDQDKAFEAWLCREMPAGTVIGDPKWWAPKILNALAHRDKQANRKGTNTLPTCAKPPAPPSPPPAQPHPPSPAVRLHLVKPAYSDGLHIKQWDNLGQLGEGVHELYLRGGQS